MSAVGRPPNDPHGSYWNARVRRLALRVFVGRVLEPLGPCLLGGAIVTSCLVLLARLRVVPEAWGAPTAFVALAAAALVALGLAARRGFPRTADMRVRLEQALHLHNRLSAAAEGVVANPPPPGHTGGPDDDARVVSWRWSQLLPLPAASLALVLVAVLLPVRPPESVRFGQVQKPPPLERLEEIVKQLDPARAIDERSLEELRDQIDQLGSRDPEAWYSHSGLEAAESLLQQTETGMSELAGNMSAAATALDQMASTAQAGGAAGEAPPGLEAALHGLEHGRMPANADMRNRLRDVSSRQLDPSTARQLADALRNNADRLNQLCQGGTGTTRLNARMLGPGSSPGNPNGTGDGDQPGTGGISRGPGTAPLTLAQNATTAEPGADGSLEGFDPSRAALGDAAGQSVGQHEIDRETAEKRAAGGQLDTEGSGGDTAWTQRLTPEERRAVRRTFD